MLDVWLGGVHSLQIKYPTYLVFYRLGAQLLIFSPTVLWLWVSYLRGHRLNRSHQSICTAFIAYFSTLIWSQWRTKHTDRGKWRKQPLKPSQSVARFKQDSRSRTFWCSRYPLGLQDSNLKYLVSFPFSRYSFLRSRSCLVFKQSTWEWIPHLDILEQM